LERADSWERKALPTPPAPVVLSLAYANKRIVARTDNGDEYLTRQRHACVGVVNWIYQFFTEDVKFV
jgi:hypothetical protein